MSALYRLWSLWPLTTKRKARKMQRNAFEIGRDSTVSNPLR